MQPVAIRQLLKFVGALLLPVILALASHAQAAFPAKVMKDADKGAMVRLKAGSVVQIRLKSNPSTGFRWYVHAQSTPLMKLVGQSQTAPTKPGVGRPIFQIFKFQAVRPGDGVLLLHYVRSWEKPAPDEQRFDLHVLVE
jgi:inhibitor of cysteine peptidase